MYLQNQNGCAIQAKVNGVLRVTGNFKEAYQLGVSIRDNIGYSVANRHYCNIITFNYLLVVIETYLVSARVFFFLLKFC